MYAARGEIQRRTGRSLDDQYFIQTLLPDYLKDYPEKAVDWDVVFDSRGHLVEPHTEIVVPLGTLDVRDYLEAIERRGVSEADATDVSWRMLPTWGSENRFSAVLFVEKEGFLPLFKAVKLAERYDIAIMSTKGMSNTASRLLVDRLCCQGGGVPLLVLHDFDKAGFSILSTLQRDTRRYEFTNTVQVIDLGLRLEDVERYDLGSEAVSYGKSNPKWNLEENGATEEEIEFLCSSDSEWSGYRGKRVELNAFTSADLVAWIEEKLKLHGIRKVLPGEECLGLACRRALEAMILEDRVRHIRQEVSKEALGVKIPRDLRARVEKRLKKEPGMPWDRAVALEAARCLAGGKS
jgi:hypothetical protein